MVYSHFQYKHTYEKIILKFLLCREGYTKKEAQKFQMW